MSQMGQLATARREGRAPALRLGEQPFTGASNHGSPAPTTAIRAGRCGLGYLRHSSIREATSPVQPV
jgi:hypothetical protein